MVRLGNCFTIIRNGASIKQIDGASGLPITRIETISKCEINRDKFGYANICDEEKYKDYFLHDDDILMSHINSEKHLGKCALYHKEKDEKIIHGMNLLMLRANKTVISPQYAVYYFETPFFKQQIVNITKKSVNQASFTVTALKEIEIPLLSYEKQNKIVKILDKLNEIINKRQQQLKKLDELVKSRFIEMFGDPLKNTLKWKIKKLKLIAPANEFTGDIESNNEKYWLLQLDMIESNTGKILSKYFVSLDKIGVSTIKFSKDNVLYSKLRPYLNKVVLPDEAGFATSEMIPLFPTEELNKIFLAFVLRDDGIVRFLNAHVSGSKMPRVQADVFWNLGIILPPSTLQNQFADFVEQTDKSKLEIQKSLDKLEILKKSLMQQYFD